MIEDLINKIENYFLYQNEIPGNLLIKNKPSKIEDKVEIHLTPNDINKDTESNNHVFNDKENSEFISNKSNLTKISSKIEIKMDQWNSITDLQEFKNCICNCQNCSLGATRTNFVFGSGNPNADIMLIGEAPGADEDEQGLPFVGRAGQLLTKIIESIKLTREEVFICNIIKCRPPNNRKPLSNEVEQCEPYLKKQIELIKPKFILLLGLTAAETLLKKNVKMGDIRGNLVEYEGIKTLITYHPAALLRNPNWKPLVWEDVKLLRRLYDDYLNKKENQ